MKYKITFHPSAYKDLENVEKYLSQYYESTVGNFIKIFEEKLKLIEENPYIYSIWEDRPKFRRFTLGNYLIFYHIIKTKQTIRICRIIDHRRNIISKDIKT